MTTPRTLRLIALASTLILLLTICLSACQKSREDNFRVYCELGIELPPEFAEFDSGGSFQRAYRTADAVVGIVRLSFEVCAEEGILTTLDPRGFAKYYLNNLDRGELEIRQSGDIVYTTYTDLSASGNEHLYMPTFYVTPYAYFIINFITPTAGSAWREADFLDLASTVRLVGEF